jgi:hypothetical protein
MSDTFKIPPREINVDLMKKILAENLIIPVEQRISFLGTRSAYSYTLEFRLCSEERLIKDLTDYISIFNVSHNSNGIVYCKRYHRFSHDSLSQIFEKLMKEIFGLEYIGSFIYNDTYYFGWKLQLN